MIINHKNIIGLSVETKSGLALGEVKGFEIDSELQNILRYSVKSKNVITKLLQKKSKELIIHRSQVVSMNSQKMVVEDVAIKKEAAVSLAQSLKQEIPIPSN